MEGEGVQVHRHHLPLLLRYAPVCALGVRFHSLDHSGLCVGRHYGSHCLSLGQVLMATTSGQGFLWLAHLEGGDSHRESEGGPLISSVQTITNPLLYYALVIAPYTTHSVIHGKLLCMQ